MEIFIILINFIAMLLASVWSSRAETEGDKGTSKGLFAYGDVPEMRIKSTRRPPLGSRQ